MRYVRAVSTNISEQSLTVPIYRFLVGVAGGGRDKDAASAMFNFIDKKLHKDGWKTIFGEIQNFSTLLDSPLAPLLQNKVLSQEQIEKEINESIPKMIDIMRLISCSVVNPDSAHRLSTIDPIKQLFGLLLTPVPVTLKGTRSVTALIY